MHLLAGRLSCPAGPRLQVLVRLGQAQGVKAAVARQRAVQPGRPLRVGQPQVLACGGAAGTLHRQREARRPQPVDMHSRLRNQSDRSLPTALRLDSAASTNSCSRMQSRAACVGRRQRRSACQVTGSQVTGRRAGKEGTSVRGGGPGAGGRRRGRTLELLEAGRARALPVGLGHGALQRRRHRFLRLLDRPLGQLGQRRLARQRLLQLLGARLRLLGRALRAAPGHRSESGPLPTPRGSEHAAADNAPRLARRSGPQLPRARLRLHNLSALASLSRRVARSVPGIGNSVPVIATSLNTDTRSADRHTKYRRVG